MKLWKSWLLVTVCVVCAAARTAGGTGTRGASAHQHHQHMKGHHVPQSKANGGALLKDDELLQDRDHIREDLAGKLTEEQINRMDRKEIEFHYFREHDFDDNYRLDGLELMAALAHVIQHDDGDDDERLDLAELKLVEELIDDVLREGDRNGDGFLTYGEYRYSRKKLSEQ